MSLWPAAHTQSDPVGSLLTLFKSLIKTELEALINIIFEMDQGTPGGYGGTPGADGPLREQMRYDEINFGQDSKRE